MTIAFAALFFLYLAQSVYANYVTEPEEGEKVPVTQPRKWAFLLQSPLFVLSCILAAGYGVFSRDLVSPFYIPIGLVLGHFLFGFSLLVTHRELRDAAAHVLDWQALWHFLVENPNLLFRFVAVSFTEEIIYRAVAQPLLIGWTSSVAVGIVLTAAAFSVVHWHFFRNPFGQSLEFFAFSLLLGGLYLLTGSLSLVVVIHTVRNLEIVYLEYIIKVEELGDESRAMEALEAQYARRTEPQT